MRLINSITSGCITPFAHTNALRQIYDFSTSVKDNGPPTENSPYQHVKVILVLWQWLPMEWRRLIRLALLRIATQKDLSFIRSSLTRWCMSHASSQTSAEASMNASICNQIGSVQTLSYFVQFKLLPNYASSRSYRPGYGVTLDSHPWKLVLDIRFQQVRPCSLTATFANVSGRFLATPRDRTITNLPFAPMLSWMLR